MPEWPGCDLPEHPEWPGLPEHPDWPEMPEHPDWPEMPDLPECGDWDFGCGGHKPDGAVYHLNGVIDTEVDIIEDNIVGCLPGGQTESGGKLSANTFA